jgi:hypothetical protein
MALQTMIYCMARFEPPYTEGRGVNYRVSRLIVFPKGDELWGSI